MPIRPARALRAILVAALAYAMALQGIGVAAASARHAAQPGFGLLCPIPAENPAPAHAAGADPCCLLACASVGAGATGSERPFAPVLRSPAALGFAAPAAHPLSSAARHGLPGARAPPPELA